MAAISVTTSATLIATGSGRPAEVLVSNDSGNIVYLGTTDAVTTANGLRLDSGKTLGLNLRAGGRVWGIAGGTSEVRVESWG